MAAVFPAQPEPTMMTLCMLFLGEVSCYQTMEGLLRILKERLEMDAGADDLVGNQRAYIGQQRHISELHRRPAPATGFAAHDCNRRHALHREGEEHQKRHRASRAEIALQRLAQPKRFFRAFLAV